MFQILIAEDDISLRRLFMAALKKNNYKVYGAADGEEALQILDTEYIDLLICDIMMPRMDGYELTSLIRESGMEIPVLMITAKSTYQDKEMGFLAGTDDYMVKPIDLDEMVLRVAALLRRSHIVHDKQIVVGDTILKFEEMTISYKGTVQLLPQKEFYLLYKLLAFPNKIFTRMQLMDEIWGMDTESDIHTVDVHVARLREKLHDNKDIEIVTIRGLGYKAVKKV